MSAVMGDGVVGGGGVGGAGFGVDGRRGQPPDLVDQGVFHVVAEGVCLQQG